MHLFSADEKFEQIGVKKSKVLKNFKVRISFLEGSFYFHRFSEHSFGFYTNDGSRPRCFMIFTYSNLRNEEPLDFIDFEIEDIKLLSQKYKKCSFEVHETGQFLPLSLSKCYLASLNLTSNEASFLNKILESSNNFCKRFTNYIIDNEKTNEKNFSKQHDRKGCSLILLKLTPSSLSLNYSWNAKMFRLVYKQMVLVEGMNWLSTLGGAYCALADQDQAFLKTARVISGEQLLLSMQLADFNMMLKCVLFIALNKVQQGRYKQAARLVRYVYEKCKGNKTEEDKKMLVKNNGGFEKRISNGKTVENRFSKKKYLSEDEIIIVKMDELMVGGQPVTQIETLIRMCHGIWTKLKYERSRKFQITV